MAEGINSPTNCPLTSTHIHPQIHLHKTNKEMYYTTMSKFKNKKTWLKESFQTITKKKNLDSSVSEQKLFVPIQRQNWSVLALPCKLMCWLTWSQRCIPVESSSEILAVFLRLHVQGEHFGNFPAKTSTSSIYFTLTLVQKEENWNHLPSQTDRVEIFVRTHCTC